MGAVHAIKKKSKSIAQPVSAANSLPESLWFSKCGLNIEKSMQEFKKTTSDP